MEDEIFEITQGQKKLREWGVEADKPFNWSAYNNSQTKEKIMFIELLNDLCQLIDDKESDLYGRDRKSIAHKIFCIGLKSYSNTSSRRLISELELCKRKGFLNSVPHFNTVLNYLNDANVRRVLNYLIELSALPLAQLENQSFAIDSTGFSERKYLDRWSVIRQEYSKHKSYRKAHCIYGTKSNVVVSAIITDGNSADSPRFKELLSSASRNFNVKEITADLAYSSRENLKHAESLNITPFIPFKKNAIGASKGATIWNKMYKYFKNNPNDFLKHYHARSNAESGFFMIKQRFGDFVRCKTELSQTNEVLAKILCHNICVLIQEIFLNHIETDFFLCAKQYVAHRR